MMGHMNRVYAAVEETPKFYPDASVERVGGYGSVGSKRRHSQRHWPTPASAFLAVPEPAHIPY